MEIATCYHSRVRSFPERAMSTTTRVIATFLAGALLSACGTREAAAPAPGAARPVVVQGAMDVEVKTLAGALANVTEEKVQGWTFWSGTLDGYPVVISKTLKGMSNAAAATAIAAERYHPVAIINEGTSGGHDPGLHVFDIVLGTQTVNIGAFKTGYRAHGEGSNFADWNPLDLMRSEGSAGQDPNARTMRRFPGDEKLLAAARSAGGTYRKGRVVEGVIGSSDMWNSEIDRIQRFHEQFGTTAEEMEAASAAQIAGQFQIPFLGIRVLSNNITNSGAYDAGTGDACQQFVLAVVKKYASAPSQTAQTNRSFAP
jgi:adenosylhomocysteine nucleosidase